MLLTRASQEARTCIPIATGTAGVRGVSAVCDPQSLSAVAVGTGRGTGTKRAKKGRPLRGNPRVFVCEPFMTTGSPPRGEEIWRAIDQALRAIDWKAWFGCPEGADHLSLQGVPIPSPPLKPWTSLVGPPLPLSCGISPPANALARQSRRTTRKKPSTPRRMGIPINSRPDFLGGTSHALMIPVHYRRMPCKAVGFPLNPSR